MTQGKDESLYGEQLSAGALVGGYVVECVHHPGPLATLYRARNVRTGTPAALKVMHVQPASSRDALRRFRREAATLQRLRHPHIVEILDCADSLASLRSSRKGRAVIRITTLLRERSGCPFGVSSMWLAHLTNPSELAQTLRRRVEN